MDSSELGFVFFPDDPAAYPHHAALVGLSWEDTHVLRPLREGGLGDS